VTSGITEDVVEQAALSWLGAVGCAARHGPEIGPESANPERDAEYRNTVLAGRLRDALARLNPELPAEALEDAYRQLTLAPYPTLLQNNQHFQRMLRAGVDVTFRETSRIPETSSFRNSGFRDSRTRKARAIDWDTPENNDWLAVNQFSVRREGMLPNPAKPLEGTYRPDVVLFCNGLPLVVIELKNPADEDATVEDAYHQLRTYMAEIPAIFHYNALLVIADGLQARMGALTAPYEWFKPWKTIDGTTIERDRSELEVLIKGALRPAVLLDLARYFTVFEERHGRVNKKTAFYHQYHAVNKAVQRTVQTVLQPDARQVGVIWHTQGSGKSLSMLFYAGKMSREPLMRNPTVVVLTDRNDLDDQLFDTFTAGRELLGQEPHQVQSREDLRGRLQVASGGIYFTTIQKFSLTDAEMAHGQHPLITGRDNVVFIVDEAHRTQYGLDPSFVTEADRVVERYGFAKYVRDALPNAAFIAFTGTPIDLVGRSTLNVFGDYIDTYKLSRAVEDGATVPIYYEARHAKIGLPEEMIPRIDAEFAGLTAGEDEEQRRRLARKWGNWSAIIGNPKRLGLVAKDIVEHFEQRDAPLDGKGMIVCMQREMAAIMYNEIAALRPDWVGDSDDQGILKVVMTGSASDPALLQPHIRLKSEREKLADRFRDPHDNSLKLVIVVDMWLTGFDAPSLHVMYVDKPMQGHNLMQAIARVNRVHPDKEGGLVVAYLPLELPLQEALKAYDDEDKEEFRQLQAAAVPVMLEKLEVVRAMFHGFNYRRFLETEDPGERLTVLAKAVNHILAGREKKTQAYIREVTALSNAYALANPLEEARSIRREVGFFNAVKAALVKETTAGFTRTGKTPQELDAAVEKLVTDALAPGEVISLAELVNMPERTDISILSEEFLAKVEALPERNLAAEMLRRLLEDAIRAGRRRNLMQSQRFAEKLQEAVRKYNQEMITSSQVLEELIRLAAEMRQAGQRGEELGLTEEELAFYDALETNDSAVAILGDETLREIAQMLVLEVRKNISIDWELREDARARMRVAVKRVLRRYGYPPDKQPKATETVVMQAELLSREWAAG